MRSVRSLAQAQLKRMPPPDVTAELLAPVMSEPKKKKKKDKDKVKNQCKEKGKEGEKAATVRFSGSGFEAGALTASPDKNATRASLKKKSIFGLGLPSAMHLPSMRSESTASSIVDSRMQTSDGLSADPAAVLGCSILAGARSGSTRTASSASSVRPREALWRVFREVGRGRVAEYERGEKKRVRIEEGQA